MTPALPSLWPGLTSTSSRRASRTGRSLGGDAAPALLESVLSAELLSELSIVSLVLEVLLLALRSDLECLRRARWRPLALSPWRWFLLESGDRDRERDLFLVGPR